MAQDREQGIGGGQAGAGGGHRHRQVQRHTSSHQAALPIPNFAFFQNFFLINRSKRALRVKKLKSSVKLCICIWLIDTAPSIYSIGRIQIFKKMDPSATNKAKISIKKTGRGNLNPRKIYTSRDGQDLPDMKF